MLTAMNQVQPVQYPELLGRVSSAGRRLEYGLGLGADVRNRRSGHSTCGIWATRRPPGTAQ